jgi:hypothetical protein
MGSVGLWAWVLVVLLTLLWVAFYGSVVM